jgi:hypothetical protein
VPAYPHAESRYRTHRNEKAQISEANSLYLPGGKRKPHGSAQGSQTSLSPVTRNLGRVGGAHRLEKVTNKAASPPSSVRWLKPRGISALPYSGPPNLYCRCFTIWRAATYLHSSCRPVTFDITVKRLWPRFYWSANRKVWTRKPKPATSSCGLPTCRSFCFRPYSEMREGILRLVDEYVMKSELPERLVPILGRAQRTRTSFHLTIPASRSGSISSVTAPFWWQSVLCCSAVSKNRHSKSRLSQGFPLSRCKT